MYRGDSGVPCQRLGRRRSARHLPAQRPAWRKAGRARGAGAVAPAPRFIRTRARPKSTPLEVGGPATTQQQQLGTGKLAATSCAGIVPLAQCRETIRPVCHPQLRAHTREFSSAAYAHIVVPQRPPPRAASPGAARHTTIHRRQLRRVKHIDVIGVGNRGLQHRRQIVRAAADMKLRRVDAILSGAPALKAGKKTAS